MSIKMTPSNTLTLVASVLEIENAIQRLSRNELANLRDWFIDFDAAAWDKQFEEDVAAGNLDTLANAAIEDLCAGRCTEL